ncbi:MAG: hypothetical protein CTY29_08730 [Methylobacter sp.]|nr:MAG: hypothetical protein CTY29_08730 [Methylobacter sp.]
MPNNQKKKAILDQIKVLEDEIVKAREYLEIGAHAHWHGFNPLFKWKTKEGEVIPPNKEWVQNVFLPSREKALKKAEKLIDRFE